MAVTDETELDARDPAMFATVAIDQQELAKRTTGGIAPRLGRYMILDVLGSGAMGVVLSAFDPQLDRRVAVKVLKSGIGDESERRRLLREAQAMAKVTHPNVVSVYDAGEEDGQTFIAMEFVRGVSLRRWLGESRSWEVIVEVFSQAGRGLQAAHSEGIVHRDFKPDNVLITNDGVAKVADFGLARTIEAPAFEDAVSPDADTMSAMGVILTKAGMLVGTPAYMSPEQYLGVGADPRSDQFSFFVAIFEALYGYLPFEGASIPILATNITSGHRRPRPAETRVPRWVEAIVARGLQPHREDRWPTMHEALAALDPGTRRRRRGKWVALAVGCFLVGGALGLGELSGFRVYSACSGVPANIGGAWSEGPRGRIKATFLESRLPFAPDVWTRIDAELGRYISDWGELSRTTCEAGLRGELGAINHERAERCLQRRLRDFNALVEVLAQGGAEVVERSVDLVASLSPVASCGDLEHLAARDDRGPPPGVGAAVEAIRDELVTVRLARSASSADIEELIARARATGFKPLVTEAILQKGVISKRFGNYGVAEGALVESFSLAEELGLEALKVQAATELVEIVGYHLARHGEGDIWGIIGEASARHRAVDDMDRVRLKNSIGMLLASSGRNDEALAHYKDALAIVERSVGRQSLEGARLLNNLGTQALVAGALDEAERLFAEALQIYESALGSSHPDVAGPLNNLGNIEVARGRDHREAARHYYERALTIYEGAYGPGHPLLAYPLLNLGDLDFIEDDFSNARVRYSRALSIRETTLGSGHPATATALGNLGLVNEMMGDAPKALPYLEKALEIYERTGKSGPDVAETRFALARALWDSSPANGLGSQRERALRLAQESQDGFVAAGFDEEAHNARMWMESRGMGIRP